MITPFDERSPLPILDLYDSNLMLRAIQVAKEDYDQARQDYKDFKKEYGDFISPIAKDMDWYRENVTGKVQDAINDLYSNGIDPLRSAEGRATIQNIINNIDTGAVGMLRQSAENARQFLNARAKLEASGLYNPLYAKYDGPSLDQYSTLGNDGQGVWDKMSPTPIQNVAVFGNPYFEGMKPNIKSASKNGVSYKVESITMEDLKRIADSKFNELVNTPQGQLMYKYFLDKTGNDVVAAREAFNNTIAAGQERRMYTNDDYDDNWYKRQQLNLQYQKMAQDQANANRSYQLELAKLGLKDQANYVQPMEQRQIDKNVTSRAEALNNYQQLFSAAIQNQQKYIDDYEKQKNISTIGYNETITPGFFTSGSGMVPTYISSSVTRTPYIKNKNSEQQLSKLKRSADSARFNINIYNEILKGGSQALMKYGYIDKNGFPTEQYTKLMTKTYLNKRAMSGLSDDQKQQTVNGLFDALYSAGSLADGDFKNWRNSQFASGNEAELPGVKGKKLISTSTGKYKYAPVYKQNSLGVKSSDIGQHLNAWLANNAEAWIWNKDNIQDYFLPSKSGEKYATEGTILVSKKDLEDFAKNYGHSLDDVVKYEKLKAHVFTNNRDATLSSYEQPLVYYEIPVIDELYNNGGFNYYRINETINKKDFGGSQNTKDREDAQRHSAMN